MTTLDQTISTTPQLPAPYVGLRPFGRGEEAIFKGRQRDAVLTRDKVFSGRIILLYGPSGVGKSSILDTLLVPQLEKAKARVIFCKDWHGDDPLETLKASLIEEAKKLKIPEPGAGGPSLTDLARLLLSADESTVVLILDQFEEFLNAPADRLDLIRRELGTLVRTSDLDVRVILSLREEHLASLEPFREEIPDLFQTTYRLEPLTDERVQEAIEAPAKLFGVEIESGKSGEPGIVEALINDLRQEERAAAPGPSVSAGTAPVDLPMLQLVCNELWEEAKKRQAKEEQKKEEIEKKPITISRKLYQELGGRQGILDRYLRRVMPEHWRGKKITAQIMRYLAPRSGYKQPFSAEDLADLTNLKLGLVQSELERLSEPDVRVMRSRKYGAGHVLYELYHDRFISIVTPWRDDILKRARFWRRAKFAAGILVLIIIFALALDGYILWRNTQAIMGSRDLTPEQKAHHVAFHLLWTRSGFHPFDIFSDRFDILEDHLKTLEKELPRHFGIDLSGLKFITLPDPNQDWPLSLHYSRARNLNEYLFAQVWRECAQSLARNRGIPIPARLRLVSEETFPKELVRLTGNEIKPLDFEIPSHEEEAYINSKQLSAPGREFLERFKGKRPIRQVKCDGDLCLVPRWSLPVWKETGVLAADGSGLLALSIDKELQNHPDRLLTPSNVEALLDNVKKLYPDTVNEARAVRGDQLPRDLQVIFKKRGGLTELPILLDILANYPNEMSSEEFVDEVMRELKYGQTPASHLFRGAHALDVPSTTAEPSDEAPSKRVHWAYRESANWLPDVEPEIRVYLGTDLSSKWVMKRNELRPEDRERLEKHRGDSPRIHIQEYALKPELRGRLEKIRDSFIREFGIRFPVVKIRPMDWDPELAGSAFRIEVLNQEKEKPDVSQTRVGANYSLDPLSKELLFSSQSSRIHFLNPEEVRLVLDGMNAELHSWLTKRYSITDLKLLLRAVVNPSDQEVAVRANALRARTVDVTFGIPLENCIRQPDWLLASLIFWEQINDTRSLAAMAEYLRATQRARIRGERTSCDNAGVERLIETGVHALSEGRVNEAKANFSRAVKSDESAAVSSFLDFYPRELRESLVKKLTDSFNYILVDYFGESGSVLRELMSILMKFGIPWEELYVSRAMRIELEDLLAEKGFDQSFDVETARRLRLCLLAANPNSYQQVQRELSEDIRNRYKTLDEWPAEEAAWFGTKLFEWFDPLGDDRSFLEAGLAFLKSAVPRLSEQRAVAQSLKVLDMCNKPGPNRWCWDLLPDLADIRKDPVIDYFTAYYLTSRDTEAYVKRAYGLADRAKEELMRHPKPSWEQQEEHLDWADFVRAKASLRLADSGNGSMKETEKTLLRLKESSKIGALAAAELAVLRRWENRFEEATAILDEAIKRGHDDPIIYQEKLAVKLVSGDKKGVAQVAMEASDKTKKDLLGKVTDDTKDFAYVAAMGMLLTETGDWERVTREFLQTNHIYAPYLAMMLYSRMTGKGKAEAKEVIERHWASVAPETWNARLSKGDETAWREMLIGYYLEKQEVRPEEIFADLKDDARFAKSDLRHLPMSRGGMLCEAYFYDALLESAKDHKDKMNASLEKTLNTNKRDYFEYAMAKFLSGR